MTDRSAPSRRSARRTAPVLGVASTLLVLGGCVSASDERQRVQSARQDPFLGAAIDLYGEYAAALAIDEVCPTAFSAAEGRFVRERTAGFINYIQNDARARGLDSGDTVRRIVSLGDRNIAEVKSVVARQGCDAPKIGRTVATVKKKAAAEATVARRPN